MSAVYEPVRVGVVSISDRASTGVYEDKGLPALQDWLGRAIKNPITWVPRLIADERSLIADTLRALVDAGLKACAIEASSKGLDGSPGTTNQRHFWSPVFAS